MTETNLNQEEFLVEAFKSDPTGDEEKDRELFMRAPVRVTHKPTGLSAIGVDQGSQRKNHEEATRLLMELLAKELENNKERKRGFEG